MTTPPQELDAAIRPPRLGVISGFGLGLIAAFALSWLGTEAWQVMLKAVQAGDNGGGLALAGLLLLGVGVVLGLVGFAGRYHPLIPGVPAIWFVIVLGPSLVGLGAPPSWFPDFATRFFLRAAGPAVYMALGYLLLATGYALFRRRHNWIFR